MLPADFTREVPARGWQWLLQYGLGWKYWQPFVGWSEKDSRLVFTVGEPTEFSMGRYIGRPTTAGEGEERLPRKWFVHGNSHQTPHLFGAGKGGSIVLVEDIVSAHKVGQITQCIPLFGTKVFDSVYPCLRFLSLPVIMWLDKDQEQHAPRRAASLSMRTGLPVSYRFTTHDPKLMSLDAIAEEIDE